MRVYEAETMTELHEMMTRSLIEAGSGELDVVSSVDVALHNVIGQAQSMDWELDLKSYWLTKSRWTMMVNQYLDPEELTAWLEMVTSKIGIKSRGIALMRTKTVAARGGEITGHNNKVSRRWGSCMIAISYKAIPRPQITLYSRTSYMGYLSALDLTVAWMCGKYIAEALNIDVKDISFVWMNEAIQWHNFKSMAWALCHTDKKTRKQMRRILIKPESKMKEADLELLHKSAALQGTRKWLAKVIQEDNDGVTYGDMNYNTYRRIRRRWHTEVWGPDYAKQFEGWSKHKRGAKTGEDKEFFKAYPELPSVKLESLDFSSLISKGADLAGAEYEGGGLSDDDDDE